MDIGLLNTTAMYVGSQVCVVERDYFVYMWMKFIDGNSNGVP